jgi:hypothetical protein
MRAALLSVLFVCAMVRPAAADAGWFESGDIVLRNDLLLLNDAGVIRLPVNQWPIPRAAVAHAVQTGKPHFATNAAVSLSLSRVRARLDGVSSSAPRGLAFDVSATAGERGLLRDFDALGREDAEIRGRATYRLAERAEVSLTITGAANPQDDEELRVDGSHASVQLGNWLVSANTLDRYWGPGHESSLILSNNARPMPTVMVERATALPFKSEWLSWLGPWRFNFAISQMENDRADIDSPLFMSWRIVIMPFKDIELGFSRTAQFCGDQLVCDVDSFFNMLAGNDNVGIDATPENEPGNQMAGFDMRWNSPIGTWPYAVYSQMIGEDESSYLPAKYIAQHGLEIWKPVSDGGLFQAFLEYSTTTCSASTGRGPYYNCAYNQGLFDMEGYRYHGRVIGHTSDRDAESYALGASYTTPNGELWTATARTSRLNRDDFGDLRNPVASVPTSYDALELGWKGRLLGQQIDVDIGVESIEPEGDERDLHAFGFIRWTHAFAP